MAEITKIQWAHHTFNPWIGCTKVHAGCENCYAEADQDHRRGRVKWGPNGTRSKTSVSYWRQPLKWNREARKAGERRRVFCASLADVFEEWGGPIVDHRGCELSINDGEGADGNIYSLDDGPVDDDWGIRDLTMDDLRKKVGLLVRCCTYLDWLFLTKRPQNAPRMLKEMGLVGAANVWLLTSVSDQQTADKYIPELLKCRDLVPVLGVSAEPLLGPIDLSPYISQLDWVIVGGESGKDARPCNLNHVREIVAQCSEAGVPCFVKQLGSFATDVEIEWPSDLVDRDYFRVPLNDPKGGDPEEWPEDLRVRQFPETRPLSASQGESDPESVVAAYKETTEK